jgi:hypothetical protein
MFVAESIGRPVVAEQWTQDFSEIGRLLSTSTFDACLADELRQTSLNPFEVSNIPCLDQSQTVRLREVVRSYAEGQSYATIDVETTKILVRQRGRVILGLVNHEQLQEDRDTSHRILMEILGTSWAKKISTGTFRFGIPLGQMVQNKQGKQVDVIHTLTDTIMPKKVRLGSMGFSLRSTKTGEIFPI